MVLKFNCDDETGARGFANVEHTQVSLKTKCVFSQKYLLFEIKKPLKIFESKRKRAMCEHESYIYNIDKVKYKNTRWIYIERDCKGCLYTDVENIFVDRKVMVILQLTRSQRS
jgi:hypothetical protein